jgi:threonylcarbamoyladenosine tRNA methylthiotransferase MtaB
VTGFRTEFLGCKVSLADSQAIRERLIADGQHEAEAAEVRVVTTCCVTAEAVAKSRKSVRRAARSAERVFVTGCAANLRDAGLDHLAANVTVVAGSPESAAERIAGWVGRLGCAGGGAGPAFSRTRAYVKIQDGCSFGCSYCVIPAVRGASRSRRAQAVLDEVTRRVRQGHREVVLTGINLGCFRDREAAMRLPQLLLAVADTPGLGRVRLSSIEVNHLTPALLDALGHPRVAPHLHVPMQSGDDGVLRTMRRHYTRSSFLAAMGRSRDRVPGLNLTTDVIVGHPAETERAFTATVDAVGEAGFTRVHVFPYSPRPDTRDAGTDTVPAAVKAERSRILRELSDRQAAAHRRRLRGSRQVVLVESADGRGYSADYTLLRAPGGAPGELVEVVA